MAAASPARPPPMIITGDLAGFCGDWDLGKSRVGFRDDWGLNLKRRRVGFEEHDSGKGRVISFIWER